MAEKYELDRWAAVVCNGFTAVNVMAGRASDHPVRGSR